MSSTARGLRGREPEAADNDRKIVIAAAEVLSRNPEAPMSEVAVRAGVGQGSLYRRYRGKNDLVRSLCLTGMAEARELVHEYLPQVRRGPDGFVRFMHRYLDSPASILFGLAGQVTSEAELVDAADATHAALGEVLAAADYLRPGLTAIDLALVVTLHARPMFGDPARDRELAHRYLQLALDGMLDSVLKGEAAAPPGRAPTRRENLDHWTTGGT